MILNIAALIALFASPTLLFWKSNRFFDGTFTSIKISIGTIAAFALTFGFASVRLGFDLTASNYNPLMAGAILFLFAGIIYPYKKLLVYVSPTVKWRGAQYNNQTFYWGRQSFKGGRLAPQGSYTGRVHWGLGLAALSVAAGGILLQCIPGFFL